MTHHSVATRFSGVFRRALIPIVVVLLGPAAASRTAHAQWQWHVTVGAQSADLGRQAFAFLPNEIWIHAGDSITWRFEVDEIHTVTFLKTVPPPSQTRPPFRAGCPGFTTSPATFDGTACVTTPPFVKGQTFTVMFPKAGNFKLVCLVHPDMTGVVHALDPTTALPHDQDFYDDQIADARQAARSGDGDGEDHEGHGESHGENGNSHTVIAGTGAISATAGGARTLSVLRFEHPAITIHAGETVEWTNIDPVTPHTITFGTEPANPIPPENVTSDADGARHAVIGSPTDHAHSGLIVAAPQDRTGLPQSAIGVTRFRVTFPHAGVFPYICALHDELGMKGKVVVVP
jgi:plastocyanin